MYRDKLFQTINLSTTLQNMFKNISSFYSFMKKKKFMEEESQKLFWIILIAMKCYNDVMDAIFNDI